MGIPVPPNRKRRYKDSNIPPLFDMRDLYNARKRKGRYQGQAKLRSDRRSPS